MLSWRWLTNLTWSSPLDGSTQRAASGSVVGDALPQVLELDPGARPDVEDLELRQPVPRRWRSPAVPGSQRTASSRATGAPAGIDGSPPKVIATVTDGASNVPSNGIGR